MIRNTGETECIHSQSPYNVWLGANVVVLPDVTIGENSVIGAGSIVTKDIPANCIAFGSPCKVYREINEHDKEYYFKNHRFDEQP